MTTGTGESIRVDLWLWYARVFKTRTRCALQVSAGKVRVGGTRIQKPSHRVVPGDVLTVVAGRDVRVLEVLALGSRRGPAVESRTLYREIPARPSPGTEVTSN
ncbi:MAG: RNA-binding S4 domain-containing protein [Paracoccaceae bacterium]|nr:RNA-binding S4 domain-containing protein [Paracoccaceae bacterium]MDE2915409.1 RNA-binding S4 domain-containing protein [Paracoccaceae bacterium]